MIALQKPTARTIPDWLQLLGWKPLDRLQSLFGLTTPEGEALLQRLPAASQSTWNAWSLKSPHLPIPNVKQLFVANRELQGPWKFVATDDGVICRGDVPRDVFVTDDAFDLSTGRTSPPLHCWVETTTRLATGEAFEFDHKKPAAAHLIDWLKEQGFVASPDQDSVKVTVPLSGAFREIAIDWQPGGMVHLAADLGRLKNWPESSQQAAADFLHEANRRLRLARVAEGGEAWKFSLEASFCAPGPGVWLQSALEALCTGMALVVQPLASLRDSGVADMLLAGTTANSKGGV